MTVHAKPSEAKMTDLEVCRLGMANRRRRKNDQAS